MPLDLLGPVPDLWHCPKSQLRSLSLCFNLHSLLESGDSKILLFFFLQEIILKYKTSYVPSSQTSIGWRKGTGFQSNTRGLSFKTFI